MRLSLLAATFATLAHAQQTPPTPALAGHTLDASGYTLSRNAVELGLFYAGYGIFDELSVGTNPAPWIVAPLFDGMSANASVKLGLRPWPRWAIGLEGSPTWLRVERGGEEIRAFLAPVTLAVSARATAKMNLSLAGRWVEVRGKNESDLSAQEIEGAAITRAVQMFVHARHRFNDKVAVYARGALQPWEQPLRVDATAELGERTSVGLEAEAETYSARPWSVLAGVHLRFGSVNLRLGFGYGNYFVPRLGLVLKKVPFPDVDLYARF